MPDPNSAAGLVQVTAWLARASALGSCLLLATCHSTGHEAAPGMTASDERPSAPASSSKTAASTATTPAAPQQAASAGTITKAAPVDAAGAGLSALTGPELQELEVPGFENAVIAVPVGSRELRPLVVALHGNFDRPEWQCDVWRSVLHGEPFILCPRGTRRTDVSRAADRWTYASAKKFSDELLASVSALQARYPGRIADTGGIFIGFSLGGIYGVPLLPRIAGRFTYAVLIDGGFEALSAPFAKQYLAAGGQRVVLACGQAPCLQLAKRQARRAEAWRLPTKVADGGKIGHTYDGAVADAVRGLLPWLVADAPEWRAVSQGAP